MEETCDLDPFRHCITIASACSQVFCQLFLEENTIGLITSRLSACLQVFYSGSAVVFLGPSSDRKPHSSRHEWRTAMN